MFLVIVLFLVILFYPYREHFSIPPLKTGLNESALTKLNRDFDDIFEKNTSSIREDRDSYLKLYNALIVVK
jgi:hypothetical protein